MSAFPSVIIGFIAGIFLAPYLEKYLLQFLLFFLILPIFLAIMLVLNRKYFVFHGIAVSVGSSIILLLMLVFGSYFISWYLSPLLEKLVFEGNFNQWIFLNFDITYDQRNSILVGFALGFAVIPTVFTLAENSFSSVPKSLITGAIALGASQQQTIKSVILPATSGGIIAAISLGFGRAVGETMIVLMASGNTPLISISPFNGFRTISATLAIEMPEAIAGGTHYRVLFLLGFLLFVFTFLINSLASFIQFRMQKRYSSGG
jgi:phosphate transport system permease protein